MKFDRHKLRKIRYERDVTQYELASSFGSQQKVISRIESGRIPNPSIHLIAKIATALGCKMDEFMT